MIITKTPLRISFVGGGTDLPAYYKNSETPGCVVSATIDKYVYIMVNKKFERDIRVSYSKTENVERVQDIEHDIVRNTMLSLSQGSAIEIVSVADVPGRGTGLGSSSAFTVGLVKAIKYHHGILPSKHYLAAKACTIEIDMCKKPIGKQDQYAAAFGGLNKIKFRADEFVFLRHISNRNTLDDLHRRLLLFYLGPREDNQILYRQGKGINKNMGIMKDMADLALQMYLDLDAGIVKNVGYYLDLNWEYKRQLADGISNNKIDVLYKRAMMAGAEGGKVLGQGGGGFMLFYAQPDTHGNISRALGLRKVDFSFVEHGSQVIYGGA